jgi:filamentous hemagglutinin family protein
LNRNVFRLVFNAERDAWVPVAENVRGRGKKKSARHLASVALGLALAAAGGAQAAPSVPAANALPVPSSGARPFIFSGSVVGGMPSVAGNAMTINTPSRTLGLNWDRFDIGSDASVTFNQPDAASRVLNRIWSADPSVIMGRLNANGEIYLINQNGILFGNGSQVNVGGHVEQVTH